MSLPRILVQIQKFERHDSNRPVSRLYARFFPDFPWSKKDMPKTKELIYMSEQDHFHEVNKLESEITRLNKIVSESRRSGAW